MQTPLVSIIITSYNYEAFLRESIDSALNQSYKNIEVICVDDGSNDGSRQLIASYRDQIQVILQSNLGQAAAMNAGFLRSVGEIVMFLDSDDYLTMDCIETAVGHWKPSFAKLYVGLQCVDKNSRSLALPKKHILKQSLLSGNLLDEVLTSGGFLHPPNSANLFARRYLMEVMPIPVQTWPTQPDIYLNHISPFYGDVGYLPNILCNYRLHQSAGTLTKNGVIVPERLLREIICHLEIDSEIFSRAKHFGYQVKTLQPERRYFFLRQVLIFRKIAGSVLADSRHQILNLSLSRVFFRLLDAVARSGQMSLQKKLVYMTWAGLIAALPVKLAASLILLTDSRFATVSKPH